MKLVRPPKLELYSFLFSMPLISAIVNLILYDDRLWKDYRVWVYSIPLIYLIGIFSWYSHVLYADWIERKYPELNQSRQRVLGKAMVLFFVMTPSILLILFIYDRFHILEYQFQDDDLFKGLLVGVGVNTIFETLYEADYVFSKMKQSAREKETMQELAVHQDFDTLKNQVNPHFLFNCLNTLSSLISVDKKRAEMFLDELSKVYRYLLKNNEEGVSTVAQEIRFIESYFNLLQTRYGNSVQLNVQIDKRYDPYLLPSLTLQLLVENAVKHNSLSKNNPLVIDIFTVAGNKLVVSNNHQPLTVKANSTKVGLKNIKSKYSLLKQSGFLVMADDKNFTVVLPLIWNPQAIKV
ncbi:sensor histidine kinase [Arenibacter palladensis]|uniref:sensor histidine kinase n=1 Tax=Arenibacter palladensis TaxID=237373 RepID=UPI0026E46152|nr:sensor histidine kinase [Arenibacter palladensis]MDO6605629.1 histidine kinase [Arenibacter palladensis]